MNYAQSHRTSRTEYGRAIQWLLLLFLALFLPASRAYAEKRIALVVGNSAYVNVPRLANPANDARLMANTLRSLGFTVIGGGAQLDLGEDGFRRAVQDFGRQLQDADVGLFYYAGHGVQLRGTNYLVPIDANPTREADADFQMVDGNLVLRQMEGAGTKLNIVILDACRNNPFGNRSLRAASGGLAQMQAPEGSLISFATQPGNVAMEGQGDSPFTLALATTIRRPGLGLFEAFNEVGLLVQRATGGAQQPWVSSSPIAGNFFFAGAPSGAEVSTGPQSADPAERAWAVTQNTTSIAVLEDFIHQFGSTVYGSMARARLEELKKTELGSHTQVALIEARYKNNNLWCYLGSRVPTKYTFCPTLFPIVRSEIIGDVLRLFFVKINDAPGTVQSDFPDFRGTVIKPGSVLFEGIGVENRIRGTFQAYYPQCRAPVPYDITDGNFGLSRYIYLVGPPPKMEGCIKSGEYAGTLHSFKNMIDFDQPTR